METKGWIKFVEYMINKKMYELDHAFRDLWSLVMFQKCSNCTGLWRVVPIHLEMHSPFYDFLHL